jgi:hypothetical protein
VLAATPAFAAPDTYYVDPAGADGNDCLSVATACQTIGGAIGKASSGDTISVGSGTYSESIVVNKGLTLQGAGAATTTIFGTGATAITITADSVTVDGFTITNPSGKHGVYAQDRSGITITNNVVTDIGSSDSTASGTNFGIGIVSSASSVDSITITDNQINHIVGGNNKSVDGIAVGWSSGAYDITGLLIQNNVISDVTSDTAAYADGGRGAYGVIINHGTGVTGKTVNARVLDNTISDLEGLWAHGIGLEGNTPNALVQCNTIRNLVDHKDPSDAVAVMVEDNASAGTVGIHGNDFVNLSVGVTHVNSAGLVDAENNWWGAGDGPGTVGPGSGAYVFPDVDYDPWLTSGSTCVPGYVPPSPIPAMPAWTALAVVLAMSGVAVLMLRRRKLGEVK